jgi:von Willebrand factor type A domain
MISIHQCTKGTRLPRLVKLTILLALVASVPFGYGQATTQNADLSAPATHSAPPISAEWPKVTLNLLIDGKGHLGSTFQVLEDHAPQRVVALVGPGSPVSLCIQIDISGSMAGRVNEIRDAAVLLVKNLPPGSEVMVVFFADKPVMASPFTPASALDPHMFENLEFGHRTALYDSIVTAEQSFVHSAHYPRRAFVLITDGRENGSSHGYNDALRSMLMPGSPFVYVLGIVHPFAATPDVNQRPPRFGDLLSSSRAHILNAPEADEVLDGAAVISGCIAAQYALTYTSTSSIRDKRLHKIEVKFPQADTQVKVESLPGYYIPGT